MRSLQHAGQLAAWRTIVGARMREVQEYRGLTLDLLNEVCQTKFSRSAYSKWEAGARSLPDDFATRFSV